MECKYCVQYQVKETSHHEHDSPPISVHLGDVRWVYVKLQQLRETYSVKADTFANALYVLQTLRLHVYHPLVMIIHSHEKHVSLQILDWYSFTSVFRGVPNKVLRMHYNYPDESSF